MGEVINFGAQRLAKPGALTRQQLRVLNYMTTFHASKQVWPTSEDIRAACSIRPRLGPAFVVCNLVRRGAVPAEAASHRLTPKDTPSNE